eukprot:3804350-Pyramimonas_sp.AAC.1
MRAVIRPSAQASSPASSWTCFRCQRDASRTIMAAFRVAPLCGGRCSIRWFFLRYGAARPSLLGVGFVSRARVPNAIHV